MKTTVFLTATWRLNNIYANGGGSQGTIIDLAAKINAQSNLDIAAKNISTKATAAFVLSDKPNETSTIKIIDSDGTAVTFEIDNEADGVTSGNVAVNAIYAAGGGATGTAADLVAKINAQSSLNVVATHPSDGRVLLTQGTRGTKGHTTITATGPKAIATFTFSDKPNEASTITIVDSDSTSVTFEIDNEADGASGSNVALNGISGAGGGATGTAADLVAKINAQSSLDVVATNPSTGKVSLIQGLGGAAGNTTITVNNASHWNSVCSVNVPSTFTGGISDHWDSVSTVNVPTAFTGAEDKIKLKQKTKGSVGNTTITVASDAATATFTFSDKPNETSTITLTDSDGTSVVFEN